MQQKNLVKTQSRAGNDTNKISALSWISDRVSSKSCVFYRLPFPRRLREVLGAHKGKEKVWYYRLRLLTSEKTWQKAQQSFNGVEMGRLGIPPVSSPTQKVPPDGM